MSAPFVALALSCSFACGKLSLRGAAKRPWLEVRRRETDARYLRFLLRRLRQSYDGTLDYVYDTIASDGFYDTHRFRVHAPELYRVYELLYPRDELQLTPEAMTVGGFALLSLLWAEGGRGTKHGPVIAHPSLRSNAQSCVDWARANDLPPLRRRPSPQTGALYLGTGFTELLRTEAARYLPPYKLESLLKVKTRSELRTKSTLRKVRSLGLLR